MSRRIRLILSIACCVLSAALSLAYADGIRKEADRVRAETLARYGGEVVSLVVAREGLEPGDIASPATVEMREWIAELAPEGALLDLDEVIGRELSVAAAKGAPLTDINFRDVTQVADVPAGHVAVSIPVTDKLGVSRSVAVGSALVAYQVGSERVELIAKDMTVLSSPGAASGIASSLQLTVAVLPDDVPAVLAASASNDLRLVMPAKDATPASSAGTDAAPAELAADALEADAAGTDLDLPASEDGGADGEGATDAASADVSASDADLAED